MITDIADERNLQPVSAEDRAARFGQTATIISIAGAQAQDAAYRLERKLFDTGHASTVLEIHDSQTTGLAHAIKNAGLLCLCIDMENEKADLAFNAESLSVDEIYAALKQQKVIF